MPVWDLSIRLFHWSCAALFLLAYGGLEGGGAPHAWAGYAIVALVLWRVALGVAGRGNARFDSFWPRLSGLRECLRTFPRGHGKWAGHNPLGALMVLFLLAMLPLVALSGWLQETDALWGEAWVQRLHEGAADVVMMAVGVHVLAVLLVQRFSGVPLVRAMVTGRRER